MSGRSEYKKILILVKTYPSPSKTYVETVCTAGIDESGNWIRIFPVPFRRYEGYKRYSKYQWINCKVYKAEAVKDNRPESYHLDGEIDCLEKISGAQRLGKWEERRRIVLDNEENRTYKSLDKLIEDGLGNKVTLAIFKPQDIKLIVNRAHKKDSTRRKLVVARVEARQGDLFDPKLYRDDFKLAEPIPYDFKYQVTDVNGKKANWKILDWELGALFLNCKKSHHGDIELAKADVIKMYRDRFLNKDKIDLYLYVGTLHQFQQRRVKNPWTIIGVAPFPKVNVRQMVFPL